MRYSAKNRFRVLVALATLALAPSAFATEMPSLAERCRFAFRDLLGLHKKAETARPDPGPARVLFSGTRADAAATLRADLDETHVLLSKFARPPSTTIYFENTDKLGHFAYDDLNIHLPRWMAGKVSSADQRLRRSVAQHEYGHAIFSANFGDYSPEWKAWYVSVTRDPAENGFASRLLKTPKPYELIRLSSPYQELFTDLLTVVAQHDPEAMAEPLAKAVIISKGKDGTTSISTVRKQTISPRSFSSAGTDPDWNQAEIDVHHLFAPVRRHLWENYFAKDRGFGEKGIMMRKVFEAIATEIMTRYDTPALHSLPPRELNDRMIRALDEALAEYKLK